MTAEQTGTTGRNSDPPKEDVEAATTSRRWPVAALMGATATGKSGIAMAVARRTGATIVNCDALQIYRGLDIGTAKPSRADRDQVPHHLYDIRDPHERFSAGEYVAEATSTLERLTRERPVLLVGGTGLYFRSLREGIAPIPPIAEELRDEVRTRSASDGPTATYERLQRLDPTRAADLRATDTQRVQRALEVYLATGRSQSEWIEEQRPPNHPWSLTPFVLTVERSLLYDRIKVRLQTMANGLWVQEVKGLLDAGVPSAAPAFQAIGYRQQLEVLQGQITEDEAFEQTLVLTRRYAKRQQTWFRKEPGERLDGTQSAMAINRIVGFFSHFFQGGGSHE